MNAAQNIGRASAGLLATISAASFNHVAAGICALVMAGYYVAKWVREDRQDRRDK